MKQLCVDGFPESTVRADIMAGFTAILERVDAVGMVCEVWLDGSFTTEKLEPDDVDFIVIAAARYRMEGTKEQAELIEWLISREDEPKHVFRCHTDVVLEFPKSSPILHDLAEENKAHYAGVYGYSVTKREPKGIVVLKIEEKGVDSSREGESI